MRFFRALGRFFSNWWLLTITAALILGLVLTWGLPLFVAALRPLWVRVTLGLVVASLWGLLVFLRMRKARKASDAIAAELAQPSAADGESAALAKRMTEALATLRSSATKKRDYLYTKPWYVIIGPPGAGKTTALLNSGLRFPIGDQALKGVGGTRNLDFWFADEAALVDTAGRYTTQDSDQAVDSRGWTSFLSLLKKNRPLQPINGIIVAIGVDELIRADCAQIDAHARAVRRRMVELRRTLEVAAPVYVMLTKSDLLAGFTEFYDDLDVGGRRSVLGATVPFTAGKPTADALARAFDEMAQAVADRQAKRLFDEVDASRRSLLLGFPAQLGSLRSRLMRFLDGAFVAGDEPGGVLRGFYLTSGVQEGTPLDRIMSGMADVYDRPQRAQGGSQGRAYFLNRLLTEVMFPEAGLVTMDPRARARQRSQLVGALAGIGALCLLVFTGWGVSYAKNRAFQGDLLTETTSAEETLKSSGVDLKEVRDGDADLQAALPALNRLRNLPRGFAQVQAGGPPLLMRLGLYQSGLSADAEQTYREALRRVMLPRLLLRLEQYMAANSGDPLKLYEPLKVYLMLGSQGPMDAASVRAWVTTDWATEVMPGSDAQAERGQLTQHLTALLSDRDMASVWPDRKAPLNGAQVASVRAAVGTLSLADRAYAVMRQKAATAGEPWLAANILSQGDALAFVNPDAVMATQVPFFFTRPGFEKSYTLGLATVQEDLKKDLWVLGGDADTEGVRSEMQNVRPGVAGLYAKDYIAAWENVIKTMQPGAYFNDPAAFGAFTKSPSPLKRVLLELRKNTIFSGGAGAVAKGELRRRTQSSRAGRLLGDMNAGRALGLSAGDEITNYFSSIHDYVGDTKSPAPIDEFVAALKSAGQAVIAAKSLGGSGGSDTTQAQMATAMATVATAAATAPAQLQPFVAAAAKGGSSAQVSAVQGAVTDAYAQSVMPACKEVAQDRYPFFGGATQDAAVPDALRVFGMGGTLDSFQRMRLAPLMDVAGPVWRWRADDPIAATLDPQSPEQFSKAAQIRDLLAAGLPLKIAVVGFGSEVDSVQFSSGGATYRFAKTDTAEKPLLWSASGGVPSAEVVLFAPAGAAAAAGAELRRFDAEGPWALFKLVDLATKENAGPLAIKATFGEGPKSATFLIKLPTEQNPFSRGGVWSFRCPLKL
ncbi:type VI secretion system membrane subunit TssM [Sphingomonas sp.]|jgi:type VI secretion system protein ImpL|uniref:type VI secretion system membrane subunit TssM n=1 Tax=Sphingomonas sp. TaxID=28214 RepID=UPI002D7F5DDC|nr:type VI secretion system membrane subunit TssM [Sphingomonas sp.]HEU0044796.1 type VI secretion system membrane subunit TssM [Sphingomonas sp.]